MLHTIRRSMSRSSLRSPNALPATARRRGRASAFRGAWPMVRPMSKSSTSIAPANLGAPVFVYMHGGTVPGAAKDAGFPAEMFVNAGAHYVALDFVGVQAVGGDLGVLVAQVRRAIAWIYKNAESFGGDPERIDVGGHSSGGHLCGQVFKARLRA